MSETKRTFCRVCEPAYPDDAAKRQIEEGARVQVSNTHGAIEVETKFTDELMQGVVAMTHGWGNQHTPGKHQNWTSIKFQDTHQRIGHPSKFRTSIIFDGCPNLSSLMDVQISGHR